MMRAGQGVDSLLTEAPDRDRARLLALFEEARRHARRRRLISAAVSVILVSAAAWGLTAGWPRQGPVRPGSAARSGTSPVVSLPPATVAWVDYSGEVHVGDLAARSQHVVATAPGLAGTGRMVQAGGRLYAVGQAGISQLDIATGAVRQLAGGDGIFASPDGQRLFVTRGSATLLELPASGPGRPRRLSLPTGWFVQPPDRAVAAGIVVDGSHGDGGPGLPSRLAIWNPGTGSVTIISQTGSTVVDAYTPPGARYSLLAWQPDCPSGNCPIEITNTSTMATVTIRSPLHHGFTISGGEFSPDGTQLAIFARTARLSPFRDNRSELGLASTATGAVRLLAGARLDTTEDAAWALWLPGEDRLLVGALNDSYAVDTSTTAVRPFFFLSSSTDHDIMDTPDINFSAVLLPGRR